MIRSTRLVQPTDQTETYQTATKQCIWLGGAKFIFFHAKGQLSRSTGTSSDSATPAAVTVAVHQRITYKEMFPNDRFTLALPNGITNASGLTQTFVGEETQTVLNSASV